MISHSGYKGFWVLYSVRCFGGWVVRVFLVGLFVFLRGLVGVFWVGVLELSLVGFVGFWGCGVGGIYVGICFKDGGWFL